MYTYTDKSATQVIKGWLHYVSMHTLDSRLNRARVRLPFSHTARLSSSTFNPAFIRLSLLTRYNSMSDIRLLKFTHYLPVREVRRMLTTLIPSRLCFFFPVISIHGLDGECQTVSLRLPYAIPYD